MALAQSPWGGLAEPKQNRCKAFVKKDEKLTKEKEKRTYYLYLCDCKTEFFLTPAKHKEFLQKKTIYSCKKCKSILRFKMLTVK